MVYTYPTVTDFKNYFTRDFMYGSSVTTVMDSDIQKAMDEAGFNFNQALFSSQSQFSIAFEYLTAHYLVIDLQNSAQGVSGQFTWLVAGRSVGNVSESYAIPPQVLEHPEYAYFSKTPYGAKYLSLIFPLLIGNMFAVYGGTNP